MSRTGTESAAGAGASMQVGSIGVFVGCAIEHRNVGANGAALAGVTFGGF